MSAILLQTTLDFVREKFTRAEVKEVKAYGGEFTAAEISKKSFTAPAIFIAPLGWSPQASGDRLRGKRVRAVSMAAFVVTKDVAGREDRMLIAMNLADRLSLALSGWEPNVGDAPYTITPLDTDPTAENLYGRAIDAAGLALWCVRWVQDVKANVPEAQLFDLLAIDIDENYHAGVVPPTPAVGGVVPTVTDSITFPLPQEP